MPARGKRPRETSPSLAAMLRRRRRELGMTLRDVEQGVRQFGRPIPFSTISRIEQGRIDPGVKRLHALLKLYDVPIHVAGDLLELEELADARPPKRLDAQALYDQGVQHWKDGNARKSLAYLLAARERASGRPELNLLRQKAAIAMAITSSSLGKRRLALAIVEELLLEPPDPSLLIPAFLQAGSAWKALGSPEVALAFYDRAAAKVQRGDHQNRAWVFHSKAAAFTALGEFAEAEVALGSALKSYRKTKDRYGEGRALITSVQRHLAAGGWSQALRAVDTALAHADRHGFERLRTLGILRRGEAQVALGETDAGLASFNEALGAAVSAGDRSAQFYAHFHLWKIHDRLGDVERANVEFNAARYFARFVDEGSEEIREIQERTAARRRRR